MNITESISTAVQSVIANKLRSALTLLSIAIGTFAIISVGIATTTLSRTVLGAIDEIGGNSFVVKRTPSIQMGNTWRKYAKRKVIGVAQANEFKEGIGTSGLVSVADEDMGKVIRSGIYSTDPDVTVWGIDENYFQLRNKNLSGGRPIVAEDLQSSRNVVVIGNDVAVKLFQGLDPIGKEITIDNYRFDVVGVLEAQGAVLGRTQDNEVYIPLPLYVKGFAEESHFSATITAKSPNDETFKSLFEDAIGIMRIIRNLKPWEDNDFEIEDNSTIKEQFSTFIDAIGYFAAFVASFALAAAGIGIMNIMLISVKERTREIGVRKALGATRNAILWQFIIEAITLCQLGGLSGVFAGILAGVVLGIATETTISIPYGWAVLSVVICTVIGIVFGAYPAYKAAKLDPIEALRYE